MPCPHGQHSDPTRCSICLGAPARKVRNDERGIVIDDKPIGRPFGKPPSTFGSGRPRKAR